MGTLKTNFHKQEIVAEKENLFSHTEVSRQVYALCHICVSALEITLVLK